MECRGSEKGGSMIKISLAFFIVSSDGLLSFYFSKKCLLSFASIPYLTVIKYLKAAPSTCEIGV